MLTQFDRLTPTCSFNRSSPRYCPPSPSPTTIPCESVPQSRVSLQLCVQQGLSGSDVQDQERVHYMPVLRSEAHEIVDEAVLGKHGCQNQGVLYEYNSVFTAAPHSLHSLGCSECAPTRSAPHDAVSPSYFPLFSSLLSLIHSFIHSSFAYHPLSRSDTTRALITKAAQRKMQGKNKSQGIRLD